VNTASQSVNEIATVWIELRHTDPLIWRQVEVPTSITLKVLHDIIQAVMGWLSGEELARCRTLRLGPFPVPPHKNCS
jgi:hypothetical protein